MLITPPDLAWVARIRGLWAFVSGCLAASAPTPPSRVRLYRCRTPSLPGDGTDGSVGPLCGRSWPWRGAWPASTAPTLQFLYWGQARSRNLSPARVASQRGCCLRRGEPGSLCIPARTCRPWSAAHLAEIPPQQVIATRANHIDHGGGRRGPAVPRRGCAQRGPGAHRAHWPGGAWAGPSAGPGVSAAPCAAGDETLAAPSAKPFRLTGHWP